MSNRRIWKLLTVAAVMACTVSSQAQEFAVKTNLLYGATTTPNIGAEMSVGDRNTVQLFYGLNPWTFNTDEHGERKAKHWLLMPEYRWWQCTSMNGFFVGVHGMGGQFNAGKVDIPVPGIFFSGDNLGSEVKNSRYEGSFLGAGATVGYQWILSRHVNVEAEAGVGYNHVWYDKFPCGECGTRLATGSTNYVGLTKLGVSLMYIF